MRARVRRSPNNQSLVPFFPVFRAHPLLFQTLLSLGYRVSDSDLMGRSMAAAFGIGTIFLTYKTASTPLRPTTGADRRGPDRPDALRRASAGRYSSTAR